MKTPLNYAFALVLMAWSWAAYAQEIPNNSFENWTEESLEKVQDWTTLGAVSTVTDASDSTYAVKLENTINDPVNIGFGIVTNIILGGGLQGGWDYDEVPLTVNFDAKYDLATGDTAQALFAFQKNGQMIGISFLTIVGNSMDTFTTFSVPVQWFLTSAPDTIQIILASRNPEDLQTDGYGYVIYDNIRLTTFTVENRKVRNPSFEQMDFDTLIYPDNWVTSDIVYSTMLGIDLPEPAVLISTDRKEGGKAIKLRNVEFLDNQLAPGVAVTGNAYIGFDQPAFPVSKRWGYLEGWWKYNSNTDTARISVIMFKNGQEIGGFRDSLLHVRLDWDYFAFQIPYFNSDVPDSAVVFMSSANFDGPVGPNAELIIDELAFTDVASVGTIVLDRITIGPVPATDHLSIRSETNLNGVITVHDATGRRVADVMMHGTSGELDVSGWQSGIYFIRINSGQGYQAVKFIKQ